MFQFAFGSMAALYIADLVLAQQGTHIGWFYKVDSIAKIIAYFAAAATPFLAKGKSDSISVMALIFIVIMLFEVLTGVIFEL